MSQLPGTLKTFLSLIYCFDEKLAAFVVFIYLLSLVCFLRFFFFVLDALQFPIICLGKFVFIYTSWAMCFFNLRSSALILRIFSLYVFCILFCWLLSLWGLCPLSPHILYPLSSESLRSVVLSPAVHGFLFTFSVLCNILLLKKKPNPFMSFWKVFFFIYVSVCLGTDLTILLFFGHFLSSRPLLFSVCLFAFSWVNFFSHCTSPYVSSPVRHGVLF